MIVGYIPALGADMVLEAGAEVGHMDSDLGSWAAALAFVAPVAVVQVGVGIGCMTVEVAHVEEADRNWREVE